MNQYALYLRKSRADLDAEARGEGETLSKHRTALRAMAERRGLFVLREYAELVSGDTIAARPQMQQLLEDVKSGMYAGVIVNDVDRLGRGDSIDQEIIKLTFAASHTLIITPNRDIDPANPSDQDMLDFSMFFARFEYRKIAQRLTVGKVRSAASGHYVAAHVPYGYMRVIENGASKIVPHPEQARIVKAMFEWYASGKLGLLAISKRLADMGIRTNNGVPFSAQSVGKILASPVYIGRMAYGITHRVSTIENGRRVKRNVPSSNPTIVENAHPAIITTELFNAAQKQRGRIAPLNTNCDMSNPLSGLIRCASCGHIMTAHRRNTIGVRYISCEYSGCSTLASKLTSVESALIESIQAYAANYTPPPPPKSTEQDMSIYTHQLDVLTKRLSRARELVETGVYSPQEYLAQRDELSKQIDAINAQIAEIKAPQRSSVTPETIQKTIDAYQHTTTAAEKNALLKSIIDHADYKKTVRAKLKGPETFTLDVFPMTM